MNKPVRFAYVGCRTSRERNARGNGIVVYGIETDGHWREVQKLDGLVNPSFLAFDRKGAMLYAVHGDGTEVSSYRIAPATGELVPVNRIACKGKNPVHLVVDPTNRFLVVANHVTAGDLVSSLAVISLKEDGALDALVDHLPLKGKLGPHRAEQPFAKPHQCLYDPSGRFIVVPDKGLDITVSHTLSGEGKLTPIAAPPAPSREGEGPRHITFSPKAPHAYVVNELSSTITACRFDAVSGALTPFQVISCLPDTFTGFSRASEIEISPDGRFVYASNRGYDSIVTFRIDEGTGRLTAVGWSETLGKTPRYFSQDPAGKHLFVANEDSDTIVRFERNTATGQLSEGKIVAQTGSPTCILFAT